MSDFARSNGGRLLVFALGLLLVGAGAALLTGGVPRFALTGAAVLCAVLCTLIAAGLSAREFPVHTAAALVALPSLLLLAWLGRGFFSRLGSTLAYGLIALGLAAAVRIFRGSAGEEQPAQE